jgi:carbamoylphosphate synthase small subunit
VHHPEASPPRDSHYLFARFVGMMETARIARTRPDSRDCR